VLVNLKLLSAFVLVADHRSFRKAAEELGLSQSTVSTQIRQLEDQLGVSLFHRTTRRVDLSPEGQQLLTFVQQALGEIQRGVDAIASAAEQQRGSINVACAPTIAAARLAEILAAFKADFPHVLVHVRELASAEMLDCIQAEEVDFGIGPRVKREIDFHFEDVLDDEICAVVPAGTVVTNEAGITLFELAGVGMLMITKSAALRADIEHSLADHHIPLNAQYEGMQVQTMLSLVEAGLGAAIVPRIALPPAAGRSFRALAIKPAMRRHICIITLSGKTLSPVAARFAATATRVLQSVL
jgi:DNA-binding transcriptional LysR family regulator